MEVLNGHHSHIRDKGFDRIGCSTFTRNPSPKRGMVLENVEKTAKESPLLVPLPFQPDTIAME
jgi:hypothetical protein